MTSLVKLKDRWTLQEAPDFHFKGIDHLISPMPVKHSYVSYGVIGLALIF
jgi:hypothetical protein